MNTICSVVSPKTPHLVVVRSDSPPMERQWGRSGDCSRWKWSRPDQRRSCPMTPCRHRCHWCLPCTLVPGDRRSVSCPPRELGARWPRRGIPGRCGPPEGSAPLCSMALPRQKSERRRRRDQPRRSRYVTTGVCRDDHPRHRGVRAAAMTAEIGTKRCPMQFTSPKLSWGTIERRTIVPVLVRSTSWQSASAPHQRRPT